MVRQKPRKSVEELYAPKFDNKVTINSQLQHIGNTPKGMRNERERERERERDREAGAYIISTSPYTSNNCAVPPGGVMSGIPSGRRKSARNTVKIDKIFPTKEEKVLNLEEVKVDHNIKAKTARPTEKCRYNSPTVYDKNYVNYSDGNQNINLPTHSSHHGSHHHHHHGHGHDDDKDDDTEEFFELIRQTVEGAIGKSVSDLLNRNFRELSAKVDRFSAELKTTNTLLNKLQTEITNKVVHYGEENSRHFRYLCMKSEYDKMFYQHHNMIANPLPSSFSQSSEKRTGISKSTTHADNDKVSNSCSCRSTKVQSVEPTKSSSAEEHSVSNKSSELGMREVLEHIQRFCTQMQLSDLKCDDRVQKSAYRLEDSIKINKQVFDEDEDDFQMSSDGMTPRSDENLHSYGGSTMRSCATARNGGGDA